MTFIGDGYKCHKGPTSSLVRFFVSYTCPFKMSSVVYVSLTDLDNIIMLGVGVRGLRSGVRIRLGQSKISRQ